nr:acyl-CoA dehydrogenase family protein [Rubrobacter marinus]
MNFELTGEQREIRDRAAEFADREVAPLAAELDLEDRVPLDLLEKLAEAGFMGLCVPEEYGGGGADFLSYALMLEEISRADAGVGVTLAVHTSAGTLPILEYGTEGRRSAGCRSSPASAASAASPSPSPRRARTPRR